MHGGSPLVAGSSILVIDRSHETREVLRLALERRGLRVLAATDSSVGWAMARLHHPEIVVFDLDSDDLAKPSVREFAASIQQQRGTLVILGNPALESNFPVGEFIAKPYHYKPLVLKIEELLRKRYCRVAA
jgi:DNA-binding response OmpR family regulator